MHSRNQRLALANVYSQAELSSISGVLLRAVSVATDSDQCFALIEGNDDRNIFHHGRMSFSAMLM